MKQRKGQTLGLTKNPPPRHGVLCQAFGVACIPHEAGQTGHARAHRGSGRRRLQRAGQGHHFIHPVQAFAVQAVEVPQPDHRRGQRRSRGCVAPLAQQPVQRQAQVVHLGTQAQQPRLAAAAGQVRRTGRRQCHEVGCVPITCFVSLTGQGQLFQRKFADRLQHRKTRLASHIVHTLYQAVVDECFNAVQRRFAAGKGLGGLHRPATGKHAQAAKQRLGGGIQQLEAPVDGVAQGLLALGRVNMAALEQRQAVMQPRRQRRWRQHPQTCGGQFDGQRQAVQAAANLYHGLQLIGLGPHIPPQRRRTRRKQGHGTGALHVRNCAAFLQAQRSGYSGHELACITHRRQQHHTGAVCKAAGQQCAGAQAHTCLARATGPGECEQPRVGRQELCHYLLQEVSAADQVVSTGRRGGGRQRGCGGPFSRR